MGDDGSAAIGLIRPCRLSGTSSAAAASSSASPTSSSPSIGHFRKCLSATDGTGYETVANIDAHTDNDTTRSSLPSIRTRRSSRRPPLGTHQQTRNDIDDDDVWRCRLGRCVLRLSLLMGAAITLICLLGRRLRGASLDDHWHCKKRAGKWREKQRDH